MNQQNRNCHRYREQIEGCQMGGGLGAWEKGKGIEKYRWLVQNSHGEVQWSTGNIVGDTGL